VDVQVFIEELRDTQHAAIVLTTHDLDEAGRLCDRIAVLDGGRVVVDGTPDELRERVASERGEPPTLESVFMAYTGRSLDEDVEDQESEAAGA
jgi:ABC-2 type transport system ATP-binding protein